MSESRLNRWNERWSQNRITFHLHDTNKGLTSNCDKLFHGKHKCRVFVPLCGKSVDMRWLYEQGHEVVGVEGVEHAVVAFFEEQELQYNISNVSSKLKIYETPDKRLKVYLCDLFDLNSDDLGKFDCVWDRGSLVAIDAEDRERYIELMHCILEPDGRILLETVEYNKEEFSGPPRSINEEETRNLYKGLEVDVLERSDVPALKQRYNLSQCHKIVSLIYQY